MGTAAPLLTVQPGGNLTIHPGGSLVIGNRDGQGYNSPVTVVPTTTWGVWGYQAGQALTTSSNNVLIGHSAGGTITTGN